MLFKGKITIVREISRNEDGDHFWEDTVTVDGLPKNELYHLFECDLIDLHDSLYDHMESMPDE